MGYSKALKFANNTSFMKKRRRRFKRSFPRLNTVANVAAKTYGIQRQVNFMKGMINSEKHYTDIDLSGSATNAGTVTLINEIAQGDDVFERNGNSILHKYIKLQWSAAISGSATTSFVRMMVVLDTANQGTPPNVTDILANASINAQKKYR